MKNESLNESTNCTNIFKNEESNLKSEYTRLWIDLINRTEKNKFGTL